jgi:hypothetical protein
MGESKLKIEALVPTIAETLMVMLLAVVLPDNTDDG